MSETFADADLLLVNQVRAVKDTLIPGKLLTYMAAGRPVLVAANPESQAAQLLRDAGGGVLIAPEDAFGAGGGGTSVLHVRMPTTLRSLR